VTTIVTNSKVFGKIYEDKIVWKNLRRKKKERDKLPKPFNNILIYCETALLCL